MKPRSKLKLLGYIGFGAISSGMMMFGGSVYAQSIEDLIEWAMDQIIAYVVGDAYETFKETIADYQKQMQDLYGGESEDVAKSVSTDGIVTDSRINVLKTIYDSRVSSEGLPIETSCHGQYAKIARRFDDAASNRATVDALGWVKGTKDYIRPEDTTIINAQDFLELEQMAQTPQSLPKSLDAAMFLTWNGYIDDDHFSFGRGFVRNATEPSLEKIVPSSELVKYQFELENPALRNSGTLELEKWGESTMAMKALYDIVMNRRRDNRAHEIMAKELSAQEIEILKPHVLDSGISLIDIINFEADLAAHNTAMLNDILYAHTTSAESAVTPTDIRAYKYLIKQKAISNAMKLRILQQENTISTLMAMVTKLRVGAS